MQLLCCGQLHEGRYAYPPPGEWECVQGSGREEESEGEARLDRIAVADESIPRGLLASSARRRRRGCVQFKTRCARRQGGSVHTRGVAWLA